MALMLYFVPSVLVLLIALPAYAKDRSTSKTDAGSWAVILLATLLWPVVLPNMLRKQFLKAQQAAAQPSSVPSEALIPNASGMDTPMADTPVSECSGTQA